jgi:hypothetical protein
MDRGPAGGVSYSLKLPPDTVELLERVAPQLLGEAAELAEVVDLVARLVARRLALDSAEALGLSPDAGPFEP